MPSKMPASYCPEPVSALGSKAKRNSGCTWNKGCQAADFKIGILSWIIRAGSAKSHAFLKVQGKAKEEGVGVMRCGNDRFRY